MAPPRPNPKEVAREARKLPAVEVGGNGNGNGRQQQHPSRRVEYVTAAISAVPVPTLGGALSANRLLISVSVCSYGFPVPVASHLYLTSSCVGRVVVICMVL
jgi:hypothetical protein